MFALLKHSRHLFPFVVKTEPGEWRGLLSFRPFLTVFHYFISFAIVHGTSKSKDDKALSAIVDIGFTSTLANTVQAKLSPAHREKKD
jgi:hypothetical protein